MKELKTQGVETDKYQFFVPEDSKAAEEEKGKAWNHRKLKKTMLKDIFLTYQELLEMKLYYEAQLDSTEDDLKILEEKVVATKKRIEEYKDTIKEWDDEIAQAEKDIPEVKENADRERAEDAEKKAKHEANMKGKGEGRAFEMNTETGNLEQVKK